MPRILFLLLLLLASLIAGAQPEPSVQLKQIDKDVWVHTSYKNYNGSLVGSNGLVVQTKQGLVLIDTPWDDDQTKALIQELAKQFPKDKVTMALITHAHEDRIGGIRTLLKNGTRVLSSSHTARLARQQGYPSPSVGLFDEAVMKIGKTKLNILFPGAGHSPDNMVIYLPKEEILFGGCLIKAKEATTLGNTADADLKQWPQSIKKVQQRFPEAKIVVPGHGSWGDSSLLSHTIELLSHY